LGKRAKCTKGCIAISNDGNKLYVSDITDLVEIDIASGKIIKRFNGPGSSFLNDVVADNLGNIYVSDTGTNTIYKLDTNFGNSTFWQQYIIFLTSLAAKPPIKWS